MSASRDVPTAPPPSALPSLAEVSDELRKVPGLPWRAAGASRVEIDSPGEGGFAVAVEATSHGRFAVELGGGFRRTFADEGAALDLFFFALCDDCRLRVIDRGGADAEWHVERAVAPASSTPPTDAWRPVMSSFSAARWFVWRARGERVLSNNVLRPPSVQPAPAPTNPTEARTQP